MDTEPKVTIEYDGADLAAAEARATELRATGARALVASWPRHIRTYRLENMNAEQIDAWLDAEAGRMAEVRS